MACDKNHQGFIVEMVEAQHLGEIPFDLIQRGPPTTEKELFHEFLLRFRLQLTIFKMQIL